MTAAAANQGPNVPASIEIEGVTLFEGKGEANTWFYIPGAPLPEMAGSRPALQLYVSASGGILQLGTRWTVTPALLEKLKVQIAKRASRQESEIRLEPAPASVKQVTVETGDGKGSMTVAGTSSSSGFPPYNAIFRVPLDNEKKNAVVAALNGRAGFLVVRYRGAVTVKVSVRAVAEGDAGSAAETLKPSSRLEEIIEWTNAAIEGGRLKLTVEAIGEADASLLSKAREVVLSRFALALQNMLCQPAPLPPSAFLLRVEALESEMMEKELNRAADVSEWFEAGKGRELITVLPGGHIESQPSPGELSADLESPAGELGPLRPSGK